MPKDDEVAERIQRELGQLIDGARSRQEKRAARLLRIACELTGEPEGTLRDEQIVTLLDRQGHTQLARELEHVWSILDASTGSQTGS